MRYRKKEAGEPAPTGRPPDVETHLCARPSNTSDAAPTQAVSRVTVAEQEAFQADMRRRLIGDEIDELAAEAELLRPVERRKASEADRVLAILDELEGRDG